MCGIVAVAAHRECADILIEGLRRLEYRGYDSAGFAVINQERQLFSHKCLGRVAALETANCCSPINGFTGIAHTRWATHGEPSVANAHPQLISGRLAVVHNGIIENHETLREELIGLGCEFKSDTDTEVILHLFDLARRDGTDFFAASTQILARLKGAYALAIIDTREPETIVVARQGSPLVIGVGIGETFAGSDTLALRSVTDTFIYLEDGDVAFLTAGKYDIYDKNGVEVQRPASRLNLDSNDVVLGHHDHYMRKEIFEQPIALRDTLGTAASFDLAFGAGAAEIFSKTEAVQILACGTSYHAGLVARHWIESCACLPCQVEVASEYRYRKSVMLPNTLVIGISQSGETADTLAALENVDAQKTLARLAICNVDYSAIIRLCELTYLTKAGPEIGVASTKAFTTQLVALLGLTFGLAIHSSRRRDPDLSIREALAQLPLLAEQVLSKDSDIKLLARQFTGRQHALFLGRGIYYPIAMEGALKLKEISYIHAEAYPAGELKHGPLALVDENMPVIAVAPDDQLMVKLRSNLEEVRARGGQLFVFSSGSADYKSMPNCQVLELPECDSLIGPVIYTIALQLLAYHVAVARGNDVDKPRNLAKSVTVE